MEINVCSEVYVGIRNRLMGRIQMTHRLSTPLIRRNISTEYKTSGH